MVRSKRRCRCRDYEMDLYLRLLKNWDGRSRIMALLMCHRMCCSMDDMHFMSMVPNNYHRNTRLYRTIFDIYHKRISTQIFQMNIQGNQYNKNNICVCNIVIEIAAHHPNSWRNYILIPVYSTHWNRYKSNKVSRCRFILSR